VARMMSHHNFRYGFASISAPAGQGRLKTSAAALPPGFSPARPAPEFLDVLPRYYPKQWPFQSRQSANPKITG
jgi:hypothetical protein